MTKRQAYRELLTPITESAGFSRIAGVFMVLSMQMRPQCPPNEQGSARLAPASRLFCSIEFCSAEGRGVGGSVRAFAAYLGFLEAQ
jgi:hypothetical protein